MGTMICQGDSHDISMVERCSVEAKKLGWQLKCKSRQLKEGVKHLMLLVEGPVVLYRAISGQKSSRQILWAADA